MQHFNLSVFCGIAAEFRLAITDRMPDAKKSDVTCEMGAIEAYLAMAVSDDASVRETVAEAVETHREANLYRKTRRDLEAGAATVKPVKAKAAVAALQATAASLGVDLTEDSIARLRGQSVPGKAKAVKRLGLIG